MILQFVLRRSITAILWTIGIVGPTYAQFVGDSYFVNPSITVKQGQSGDLNLAMFYGTQKFGAAVVNINYDPVKLKLISVTPISAGNFTPVIDWKDRNGAVRIVAVNADSKLAPIGSVGVATLRFQALPSAIGSSAVSSRISSRLTDDRVAVATGTGLSAEFLITPAAAASSVGQRVLDAVELSDEERQNLQDRAARLRRPGQSVTLQSQTLAGTAVKVTVTQSDSRREGADR